jgi:hypothetical protein
MDSIEMIDVIMWTNRENLASVLLSLPLLNRYLRKSVYKEERFILELLVHGFLGNLLLGLW